LETKLKRLSAGEEVASYCTRCRLILDHVIVAMTGESIIQVKCKTCGGSHKFRSAARTTGPVRKEKAPAGRRLTVKNPGVVWETSLSVAQGPEIPYRMTTCYSAGDVIVHTAFGRGIVQKACPGKCSVLFQDGERLLVTANS